jgi:hypothetical protein
MGAQEIEQMIRSRPDPELRRFAEWWDAHCTALLDNRASSESEAVEAELQRRRQEYRDHPERFERMDDAALNQMFHEIEAELQQCGQNIVHERSPQKLI